MKEKKKKRVYGFKEIAEVALKGCKGSYFGYMGLMFFSVVFSILGSYSLKVLVDILKGEFKGGILGDDINILEKGFIYMFGGLDFLSSNIWFFAVIIVGLALLTGLTIFIRRIMQSKFQSMIGKNLEDKLFYHIEKMPYYKIKTMKNGDIIQTCTNDESIIRRFFSGDISTIVYTSYTIIIAYTILLITSWEIALVCMCLMPFMFVYSFFLIKEVRRRYRIVDDCEGLMTAKIEENLSSVRLVKAYNNEAYEINDFDHYIKDYKGKYMFWRRMSSFFFSSSDIFVFGQIALTTLVGAYFTSVNIINIGTYLISFTFVAQIVWPLRDVATILSNLARANASLDRMNIILANPMEDIESGLIPEIRGEVEFDDVSFAFEDQNTTDNTINHVSFKVPVGSTVAIMGKTGSGKSTLAYLLTRLYDYTDGHIYIDGTEIQEIQKKYLREKVSIVLQDPFLFSKTITENIKIAKQNATKDQIVEASKIAHIHDAILTFKDGYETAVGEKGTTLSGGQKQRVAIARTLLTEAPILVFDDSLSAVDTETDFNIRNSLKKRENKVTTFIITHRVATAKDANIIIVLDKGKISEIGSHDELIKKDGLYKNIYEIQTKMV